MDLEKTLKKWQKRLRLEDWEIQTHWVEPDELDGDLGEVFVFPEKRKANIKIAREKKDFDYSWCPWDPERTLVHELLHIYFEPLAPKNKHSKILTEQAVHTLSVALLEEHRGSSTS